MQAWVGNATPTAEPTPRGGRTPLVTDGVVRRSCFPRTSAVPRGVVGFEVESSVSTRAVDRGDTASVGGWFDLGHGSFGQVAALA